MIDRPVVRKAKRTVYLARDYGIDVERAGGVIAGLEEIGERKELDQVDDPSYHFLRRPGDPCNGGNDLNEKDVDVW